MSELPPGVEPAREPTPRDSACGILLRRGPRGALRVLLGRRSRRSRFMPGHLAFPGGRLEPGDRARSGDALAHCAAREVEEETGLSIPAELWFPAGDRITPPIFPVRFRTRFFIAGADPAGPDALDPPSPENDELRFRDPGSVLAEWTRGEARIPPPVLPILRVLASTADLPLEELAGRVAAANGLEERSPRIEFVPGIWMLPVRTRTLPPATHTNVWMPGGRDFVVVDPGSPDTAEIDRLLGVIRRRRGSGRPVAVLLTHAHGDHVGGAVSVARALDVPLRAHPLALERLGAQGGCDPIEDGGRIDLDGASLEALATPGHAPDHLAFRIEPHGVLVAGDLVGGLSTILIDPEHGHMGRYLASLERCAALGCRTLLPGHGPPVAGRELGRVLEHRRRREARIVERLAAAPATLDELAAAAYADSPGLPAALTARQSLAHLVQLEREGRARRGDGAGMQWRTAARDAPAEGTARRILDRLRRAFEPRHLELDDDSALHAGHRGATSGGGHYTVRIVAEAFEGRSRLEQHRLVNAELADLFGREIHALALETRAPSEWRRR